jgi:hypothetical protein
MKIEMFLFVVSWRLLSAFARITWEEFMFMVPSGRKTADGKVIAQYI